jgi:hypothetical protein
MDIHLKSTSLLRDVRSVLLIDDFIVLSKRQGFKALRQQGNRTLGSHDKRVSDENNHLSIPRTRSVPSHALSRAFRNRVCLKI